MVNDNKSLEENFARIVWGKRDADLPILELNLAREITPRELDNLKKRYAYVQILNPQAPSTESGDIRSIRSRSGWVILDYGSAMCSSPGAMLFDHGSYQIAEDGSLERAYSGLGTHTLQLVNTAADMVRIAKNENRWPTIHIVDGHRRMCWAIWKAAQDLQIPVTGFTPSKEEEAKYYRILNQCPNTLVIHSELPTLS